MPQIQRGPRRRAANARGIGRAERQINAPKNLPNEPPQQRATEVYDGRTHLCTLAGSGSRWRAWDERGFLLGLFDDREAARAAVVGAAREEDSA